MCDNVTEILSQKLSSNSKFLKTSDLRLRFFSRSKSNSTFSQQYYLNSVFLYIHVLLFLRFTEVFGTSPVNRPNLLLAYEY
jgi:hypothetical protein